MGHRASGIGHRASGIGHYQLLITYYQFSIVPHLSEKGYSWLLLVSCYWLVVIG
ncbi:hypothetical protein [Tychonema bourrellyi]|uniref:hypothetical protein n=1 Tax=Tychonema bourrellyi TaxID=54313 RepID=UPI0015D49B9D|nr:hypothetical protein [Tychonema bourrellyi]